MIKPERSGSTTVRNAEQRARSIARKYCEAYDCPSANEFDRLRANLATTIIQNAESISGLDDAELRSACRQQVEVQAMARFVEGLEPSQDRLSIDVRRRLFDAAKPEFETEIAAATDLLFDFAQKRRQQIWWIALRDLEQIRVAKETCAAMASTAVH